jgi:hypothetical protein
MTEERRAKTGTRFSSWLGGRRFGIASFILGSTVLSLLAHPKPADAFQVQCIEESKYKYLYELFGGDPRKFAAYLEIDPAAHRLPDPELCRAVLLIGGIGDKDDRARFLETVVRTRGWLATVYLSSGGGSTNVGWEVGFVVRSFVLKIRTAPVTGNKIAYQPDFGLPPLAPATPGAAAPPPPPPAPIGPPDPRLSLIAGWQTYQNSQRKLLSNAPPGVDQLHDPFHDGNWCASACSYIYVSGIDRGGLVHVHHAANDTPTMSEFARGLEEFERQQNRFYRYMDPGPKLIPIVLATSSTSISRAPVLRFPRYISDYLIRNCKSDPELLQNLEVELEVALRELKPASSDLSIDTDGLRAARAALHERRRTVELCVAQAIERDRLTAFDRYCGRGCDPKKLWDVMSGELGKILFEKK